jgi:hypothetical protein
MQSFDHVLLVSKKSKEIQIVMMFIELAIRDIFQSTWYLSNQSKMPCGSLIIFDSHFFFLKNRITQIFIRKIILAKWFKKKMQKKIFVNAIFKSKLFIGIKNSKRSIDNLFIKLIFFSLFHLFIINSTTTRNSWLHFVDYEE